MEKMLKNMQKRIIYTGHTFRLFILNVNKYRNITMDPSLCEKCQEKIIVSLKRVKG